MPQLLVVDDEPAICWALRKMAESLGCQTQTCSTAEAALELLDTFPPDVLVLDVRLPGMDGLTAMEQFRRRLPEAPIIVITAHGDLQTAVNAVRQGAFEYLVKPFNLAQVQKVVQRAFSHSREAKERRSADSRSDNLKAAESETTDSAAASVGGLVGKTPAMQDAFKRIALAAAADACVLITGESGTGKELAARAIHQFSRRADGPFIAVNVASLSPTLAESELFGHQRGAFTGAEQSRVGLLAQADGGTLFLDEVADIPLPVQVKLLRVLEHGEVSPVGGSRAVKTDFRVVSATHQDLLEQVRQGAFRHDLYFRLCAFQIDLPPLRSRREDIGRLAAHFIALHADRNSNGALRLAPEALAELEQRLWYGNVRELRNAIEHAFILARGGAIAPEHLPPSIAPMADEHGRRDTLASMIKSWAAERLNKNEAESKDLYEELLRLVEPPLLKAALEKHHGQCAAAARELGMHRTTLKKKIDLYQLGDSAE